MKMDTYRRGYKNKIDWPGWAGKVWAVPFPPTQTENFCVTYLGMFTSPRSAVPSPSRLHRGKTDPNVVYSSYRPRKSSDNEILATTALFTTILWLFEKRVESFCGLLICVPHFHTLNTVIPSNGTVPLHTKVKASYIGKYLNTHEDKIKR